MTTAATINTMIDEVRDSPSGDEPPKRSRWSNVGWIVLAVVIAALIVGLVLRLSGTSEGVSVSNAIARGKRPVAPAIPDRVLAANGSSHLPGWYRRHLRDARSGSGSILVVNFWASWCGPCREETPMLLDVGDAYAGEGVHVVGMNPASEDAERDARAFVREFAVTYPIVRVRESEKDAWGVRGFPETFIVGRDGRIAAKVNGPIDEQSLVRLLDRELKR